MKTMVDFAVCTGIGIYGLVLFFLGGSSYDLYVFLVIALVGLAIYFPRYSRWEERMRVVLDSCARDARGPGRIERRLTTAGRRHA